MSQQCTEAPLQVLASCNDTLAETGRGPAYDLRVVAKVPGLVRTSSGLCIAAEPLPPPSSACDTLIVAGGWGVHDAAADATLVGWVRERAGVARRLASVCTGAFLLAAAGLLDGRRAATHWADCERLARRHPRVRVESDPIFVEDEGVWTSAGVTAGIDLALALAERDVGRATALAVARRLVVFLKRPGGQAQFSAALALQASGSFEELHAWMREHPSADLRVPALAARAGLSERSFARRYAAETGLTPARAVERVRVEAARAALGGPASLKAVARGCGFGSEETMRRGFLRVLGVGPSEYRRRFAASGGAPPSATDARD